MADGVFVTMAREVERSMAVADRDPGPRELANLRRDIEQLKNTLDTRFAILQQASHDRAKSRLPYRDD